ncbi:histone acetyltransferase subunit 3-like protein [Diplogelasinospora grovesii]|uniref:Histone acetyltransferase subunit 3-like protein n=1 Tax=Diplogelasinospora grovesii TaxID=303347 RepID=A0AAN6MVG6_9PEZI|nr:histone acetyltransferase subunit 3-like protein [Diplogelasinospora grovesii]
MPPPSSQKGTGKKGGPGAIRGSQPQRSRNTTPNAGAPSQGASLPPIESVQTETLDLRFEQFRNLTYEDLVDPAASSTPIPDSKSLDGILTRLQKLGDVVDKRGVYCDRGMRLLAQNRRLRMDELAAERGREEERRQREADDEERERKANKKKRKATESLAPGGSTVERSSPLRESGGKPRKLSRDNDSASSSLSPVAPRTPSAMDVDDKTKVEAAAAAPKKDDDDDDDSSDDGRPPPPARPQANTFGDDPSTFPDPTVYEIRPVKPGMSEEEIKEIYSVAAYPRSDLADLIAGDPPDKDFSNAKPSNQINFSTFNTYIEPYFRPFTEEDLAFLRERGDRVTPFVMPKRGKKHYTEIWAEEDGAMAIDSSPRRDKLPPNQARGSIENMDDEVAETDKLSVGPLLSRLLQAMRPEHRAPPPADPAMTNGIYSLADGDIGNGLDFNFSLSTDPPPPPPPPVQSGINGGTNGIISNGMMTNGVVNNGVNGSTEPGQSNSLPPATYMPESNSEAWRKASHPKLDYSQVDERIKQELRHIGFLPLLPDVPPSNGGPNQPDPAAVADYDGHFDDEVAARMRLLQSRLREQVLLNGARKARLTELVKERMAYQEYQTILEDLDSQVQAAYLKRTRTMGKKPKKARPGQPATAPAAGAAGAGGANGANGGGGAGMARPGIGDLTRTLMERRRKWIDRIGPVFLDENTEAIGGSSVSKVPHGPDSSIFKPGDMADLIKKEKDLWDEEVEDE